MTAGSRVVVTAGASGIGLGIVEAFLDADARVEVCDIAQDALDALAISQPAVGRARIDVADPRAVQAWIEGAAERMGGLDVLVNNAGVGGPRDAIEDTDEGAWAETLAVNLSGPLYATKAAARVMKAQRAGAIVNVSTASVRTGLPMRSAYIASKHGLMGLTQNTARELGPFNIRCNAVLPGLIDNPRGRGLVQKMADAEGRSFAEAEADILRFVSLRTWIAPREVGDLAVFLASPAARHITGQAIGVCGGVEWEG